MTEPPKVGCVRCGGQKSHAALYCIRCWASGTTRRQRIHRALNRAMYDGHGTAARRIAYELAGFTLARDIS